MPFDPKTYSTLVTADDLNRVEIGIQTAQGGVESCAAAQSVTVLTTDDATGIATRIAEAVASSDGHVEFRNYRYDTSGTLSIPSRLNVGFNGAVLRPAAGGFAGPLLDIGLHGEPGNPEFTGQAWNHTLRDLRIEGRQLTAPGAAVADDRTVFDGIYLHDSDHTLFDNVSVQYVNGYGLKIGAAVREGEFRGVKMHRCGSSVASKPALWFVNDAAKDQNNCLDFIGLRIVYPHYVALEMDASGDKTAQGNRLITFNGGQIEYGGYGGSGTTMQTSTAGFPYDLVVLRNCKDILFTGGIEIGGVTPLGKKLLNCMGPGAGLGPGGTSNMQLLRLLGATILNTGAGDGIYLDKVDAAIVQGCSLLATSANSVKLTTGPLKLNPILDENFVVGPGGIGTGVDVTANPQIGYGFQNAINYTIPAKMVAANAPNNSIFVDVADNVMKRKDNAGAVAAI